LNESEGIPYIKTIVSVLLTAEVSGSSDTVSGVSLTEFLHEKNIRMKKRGYKNLSLDNITGCLIFT
jgi:hypothetical protein